MYDTFACLRATAALTRCHYCVTESHVAACSTSVERRRLFRERCLVIVAVAEEAAAVTRNTYTHNTHSHTPSLPGQKDAQRARVEEGLRARKSRATWSAVARAARRMREREGERENSRAADG